MILILLSCLIHSASLCIKCSYIQLSLDKHMFTQNSTAIKFYSVAKPRCHAIKHHFLYRHCYVVATHASPIDQDLWERRHLVQTCKQVKILSNLICHRKKMANHEGSFCFLQATNIASRISNQKISSSKCEYRLQVKHPLQRPWLWLGN